MLSNDQLATLALDLLNESAAAESAQSRITLAMLDASGNWCGDLAAVRFLASEICDKAPTASVKAATMATLRTRLNRAAQDQGQAVRCSIKTTKGTVTAAWEEITLPPWQETAFHKASANYARVPSTDNFVVLTDCAVELAEYRASVILTAQLEIVERANEKLELAARLATLRDVVTS